MTQYKSATEYWNARKAREAARKAIAPQILARKKFCNLCGAPMTVYGGCVSSIGTCRNAYTD